MSNHSHASAAAESADPNWQALSDNWAYAYHGAGASKKPLFQGSIKQQPEDFFVAEQLLPDNTHFDKQAGEHVWLLIRKRKQNTETVAKALARFAKVAYRDVAYSGLKDYFAVTEQWFSVWLKQKTAPDWSQFALEGVSILQSCRQAKKIKRGMHSSNFFRIVIDDFDGDINSNLELFSEKIALLKKQGVPNYFGPQRFGRDYANMSKVNRLFSLKQTIKDRHLRGLLYSSARAWLFNTVLSQRISDGSWQTLMPQEPTNLNGSNSVFIADDDPKLVARLAALDIHPSGPVWGKFKQEKVAQYLFLHQYESEAIQGFHNLSEGLQENGVVYQRRALRMAVNDLQFVCLPDNKIELSFSLLKGQFATAVLRELICMNDG